MKRRCAVLGQFGRSCQLHPQTRHETYKTGCRIAGFMHFALLNSFLRSHQRNREKSNPVCIIKKNISHRVLSSLEFCARLGPNLTKLDHLFAGQARYYPVETTIIISHSNRYNRKDIMISNYND